MERKLSEEQKYVIARKRVEKISKFYKHLAIYIVVNLILSIIFISEDINNGDSFEVAILDHLNYKIWLHWGLGILFQAVNTFGLSLFLNKDWEKRKIQEYLEEENYKKYNGK